MPPLPKALAYLARDDRPIHVGTKEVITLVEHWGFTRNGEEFVKKLIRCGVLQPKNLRHQRGNRYATEAVLSIYYAEQTED